MIAPTNHNRSIATIHQAYQLSEKFFQSNAPELGSDEHLDAINRNADFFKKLAQTLESVNNLIEEDFPKSKVDAEVIKVAMHSLHSSISIFIDKIRKSPVDAKSYIKCIDELESENMQLLEYINDINDYILSDDFDIEY